MPSAELALLTITEASDLLRRREITPLALTESVLERIDRFEERINAYITVMAEEALQAAQTATDDIAAGHYHGPLHGVPIAVKDLCQTRGVRTTAGGKLLAQWVPEEDATLVTKLRQAGAVIIGKTNLHEYAYGVTTANAHYGPTHNPWNLDYHPGGSSGGSGAALAAGLCLGATGSDTGGSIRLPAAHCSIVGLKPTYGRVSRYGCIPLAWSLDHMGPMAKTVRDVGLILNAIAGPDPKDPTMSDAPVPDFTADIDQGIQGLRFGVLRGYAEEHIEPDVRAAFEEAMSTLRNLGAELEDVWIESLNQAPTVVATIMGSEATAYHLRNLYTRPDDYSDEIRIRLKSGINYLAVDYVQAQRVRGIITAEVNQVLQQCDALLTPTSPLLSQRIADLSRAVGPALATRYTAPFNMTGHPALSVPCGFSKDGLPIGLQIVGRFFDELTVLRSGHAYEQATEWHRRRPSIS